MIDNIIIRKGQTYSHKNNTRYYEIDSIFNGRVYFQYYDSKKDTTNYAERDLMMFESLVKDGTLIRDL